MATEQLLKIKDVRGRKPLSRPVAKTLLNRQVALPHGNGCRAHNNCFSCPFVGECAEDNRNFQRIASFTGKIIINKTFNEKDYC